MRKVAFAFEQADEVTKTFGNVVGHTGQLRKVAFAFEQGARPGVRSRSR